MKTIKFNDEVLFADSPVVITGVRELARLKSQAQLNRRKRIRLCAHKDIEDRLHEMLIVHTNETYVRPHKHLNKTESLHIIEGTADVVLFEETGKVRQVIRMGDYASGDNFFCRISAPVFHMLIITSEFFVFHETTGGPFNREDTVFPPWAPADDQYTAQKEFVARLNMTR